MRSYNPQGMPRLGLTLENLLREHKGNLAYVHAIDMAAQMIVIESTLKEALAVGAKIDMKEIVETLAATNDWWTQTLKSDYAHIPTQFEDVRRIINAFFEEASFK